MENPTLEFMKTNNLPMDRANYLAVAYMGNPPPDSTEEIDFPVEILRAERRLIARQDAEFLREVGTKW